MNYKVLYRKYRPDNFENIVGQDKIVKILKNSIINKKISHAYIFSGPRGTGKTSSAKIFAKNINCLNPVDGSACGECVNCSNITTSSDIIEIDAASNNGVEEIRELINNIKLVPTMLKYKVYIIDEVHMLSINAFNALLLTLEEPPAHVIFIFATTNIENVPITILSRCQRFDFKKITNEDICKRLKEICKIEKIKITEDAIYQIAKISDGGLRDALSLLDQLSKENDDINLDVVVKYTGNVTDSIIQEMLELLNQNKAVELDNLLKNIFQQSVDYKLLIKLLVQQIGIEVKEKVVNNKQSRLTVQNYKNLILDLTNFQNKINVNVDVYSILLVILFSYIEFKETTVTTDNIIVSKEVKILKKIEIEKNTKDDNILKDIRINNCFAEANKDEKNKLVLIWNKFIHDVDINLKGLLLDTNIAMCSPNIVTVSVDRENDLEELEKSYESLVDNFEKITKLNYKLVLVSKYRWNELVLKYKKDKESGIIYTVQDESKFMNKEKLEFDDIFDNIEEI